ncbi:MAG: hypothetical protein IJW30_02220 [Clostridia bacterium]|nr:hypothetical protein [Clostridia bacterium]
MKQASTKAASHYQFTQFGAAYRILHTPAFSALCNWGIVLSVIALIGYIRLWFEGTLSWETPVHRVLTVLVSFIVLLGIGANVGTWMMKKARNDFGFHIGSILFAAFFGGFGFSYVAIFVALPIAAVGWQALLTVALPTIITAAVGWGVKKATANFGVACYVSFVVLGSLSLILVAWILFVPLRSFVVSMLGIEMLYLVLIVFLFAFLVSLIFFRVFQYVMFVTHRLQNKESQYFPPCNPPMISLIVLGSILCIAVFTGFMVGAINGSITLWSGLLTIFASVVYPVYFISLFQFFKQLHVDIAPKK